MSTENKKTLIVGASERPDRYAYLAANRLLSYGHPIELLGLRAGQVRGHQIQTGYPALEGIDTVTMYVGARNQASYVDYLKQLKPRRVIFNPGAENPAFEKELNEAGIETIDACTLVMLSAGTY